MVLSQCEDNLADLCHIVLNPTTSGGHQQCPFVFISQHLESRLLRLIMRIEDCIVNTGEEREGCKSDARSVMRVLSVLKYQF